MNFKIVLTLSLLINFYINSMNISPHLTGKKRSASEISGLLISLDKSSEGKNSNKRSSEISKKETKQPTKKQKR